MSVARAVGVEGLIPEEFCEDPEAYAKGFNAGFESRVSQEIAEDPASAREWLDGIKARERVLLLNRLASEAPNSEVATWLRLLAAEHMEVDGLEPPPPVDLTPMEQAREEFLLRARESGGATQHTFNVAADLVGTAIEQVRGTIA
jgi:hypothetical protein